MTYKIDGTELNLQPTSGRWIENTSYGIDGRGHPVYSSLREFEISWDLIDIDDLDQIYSFYETCVLSGGSVVELPKYSYSSYSFYAYTGCVLYEPTVEQYFQEYVTNVRLLIAHINV